MAARVTQAGVQAITDADPSVRATQAGALFVVVRNLISGVGRVVFTPSGTAVRRAPVFIKSGSQGLVLTPSGASRQRLRRGNTQQLTLTPSGTGTPVHKRTGIQQFTFTATGSAHRASVPSTGGVVVTFHASGDVFRNRTNSGVVKIIFRVRGRTKSAEVIVGDAYLGRFQVGEEVPLFVHVVDRIGQPAAPALVPPTASFYRLTSVRGHVADAVVPKLRDSESTTGSVFAGPYRLRAGFLPGRYAVVFRYAMGGLVSLEARYFEVMPGGDAAGPVIAASAVVGPASDVVLEQVGAGKILVGSAPYPQEGRKSYITGDDPARGGQR